MAELLHVRKDTLVKPPTQLKRSAMLNLQSRFQDVPRNTYSKIPVFGKKVKCAYYTPAPTADDRSLVFYTCMSKIEESSDKHEICCLFASALAALAPELEQPLLHCLRNKGIELNVITIPSEGGQKNAEAYTEMYTPDEVNIFFTCGILICFKNATTEYIQARTRGMARRLGLTGDDVNNYNYPLTESNVMDIRWCFGGNVMLKRSMIEYLMWARNEERDFSACARYACTILAWNELEHFVVISHVLVSSQSTVLQQPEIEHELRVYEQAVISITGSEVPQFFRYYCPGEQDHILQRENVRLLAAVAHRIVKENLKNKDLVTDTEEKDSEVVNNLVDLHKEHMDCNGISIDMEALPFLFEDEDFAGMV